MPDSRLEENTDGKQQQGVSSENLGPEPGSQLQIEITHTACPRRIRNAPVCLDTAEENMTNTKVRS